MHMNQITSGKLIFHQYQPIFSLRGWEKLGYEALLRFKQLESPEPYFQLARKYGKLFELDTQSIRYAVQTFYSEENPHKHKLLFINVFPSTLMHPSFFFFIGGLIEAIKIPKKKIVLEINAEEKISDMKLLKEVVLRLKEDFLIAIDDVGNGYVSVQTIIELAPDLVKLDRYFSDGLATSVQKQKLLHAILQISYENTKIILEGLEYPEDLAMAKSIGIPYAQGYLLGKPADLHHAAY